MATYKSISIAFGNALAQAQKLENSAEQMRNASRQLDTVKESLRSEWEGEKALKEIHTDTLRLYPDPTAGDLVQIAAVIRKSAKSYRDAEIKALQAIATKGKG